MPLVSHDTAFCSIMRRPLLVSILCTGMHASLRLIEQRLFEPDYFMICNLTFLHLTVPHGAHL
jgi:hypothetical protein